jgi:hypothetical protein
MKDVVFEFDQVSVAAQETAGVRSGQDQLGMCLSRWLTKVVLAVIL